MSNKYSLKSMDTGELSAALVYEVSRFAPEEFLPVLVDAIDKATILHADQWRKNRGPHHRTPYIEHPLRNALRAVLLGVTDTPTLLANLFHDSVEDQAARMVEMSGATGRHLLQLAQGDDARIEELALMWLEDQYRGHDGAEVSELVAAVTNPLLDPNLSKAEQRACYAANVPAKIKGRAKVFVVKLMDFFDNGAGLHHNDIPGNEKMIKHLVRKYSPMPDMFLAELDSNLADIAALISEEGLVEVRTKLTSTKVRLASMAERHGLELA